MTYSVKELVYTLQGEGANAGRAAVFCRFAGCNLWSGQEADRATATCNFCDTDFVGVDGPGGGHFATAEKLAAAIAACWSPILPLPLGEGRGEGEVAKSQPKGPAKAAVESTVATPHPNPLPKGEGTRPLVVFTGGEPLLQLDEPLIAAVHQAGFEVAIETNGTLAPPPGIDWICVSPKAGAPLVLNRGDELKLIYPQPGADPEQFEHLEFDHFFLQPMAGPDEARARRLAADYCLRHPHWRLSIQMHKIVGLP